MSSTAIEIRTETCPRNTPWGRADHVEQLCEGIWIVGTPSHGGVYVAPELWETMPPDMRETNYSEGGWFEEDSDLVLPLWHFNERILEAGMSKWACEILRSGKLDESLRNSFPRVYARLFDVPIESLRGQSYTYDRECFLKENAENYVVTTAWGDWHEHVPSGYVGVCATPGADRTGKYCPAYKLVPKELYAARGSFGYVLTGDEKFWCGPNP